MENSIIKLLSFDRDNTLYDPYRGLDWSLGKIAERAFVRFEGALFSGILETLQTLKKEGYLLALSTSASTDSAHLFADKFSLRDLFTNACDGKSSVDILGKTDPKTSAKIPDKWAAQKILCAQYHLEPHAAIHIDDSMNLIEEWARQAHHEQIQGFRTLCGTLILQAWESKDSQTIAREGFQDAQKDSPNALSIAIVASPEQIPLAVRQLNAHLADTQKSGKSGGGLCLMPDQLVP